MKEEKFINSGTEYMETNENNICVLCKHLLSKKTKKCQAFGKIPDEIWEQEFIHTKQYPGQSNSIIFEHK